LKITAEEKNMRELIREFLGLFYNNGWVTGTGGGICASLDETNVLIAPTGVHKERVLPEELFVVDRTNGKVVRAPRNNTLGISECSPIFCQIMNQRGVGAVMHSHALSAVLAADTAMGKDHFLIEGLEMLKGIAGENNKSRHFVPIVNNTLYERELTQEIQLRLDKTRFASSYCILVRDHGAYIWGRDIWETKRHAEVYHYLFEATVARKKMGVKRNESPLTLAGPLAGTGTLRGAGHH